MLLLGSGGLYSDIGRKRFQEHSRSHLRVHLWAQKGTLFPYYISEPEISWACSFLDSLPFGGQA